MLRPTGQKWLKRWGDENDVHRLVSHFKSLAVTYRGEKTEEQNRQIKTTDQTIDKKLAGAYLSKGNVLWYHVAALAHKYQTTCLKPREQTSQILRIQNHILLRLYLGNAKRAGDLINLLLSEFESMQHDGNDHAAVGLCGKHKTMNNFTCRINFHGPLCTRRPRTILYTFVHIASWYKLESERSTQPQHCWERDIPV
jgi:hypothetical protein